MLKNKELGKITIQDLIEAQKHLLNSISEVDMSDELEGEAFDILVGMNSIYNRMTDRTLSG